LKESLSLQGNHRRSCYLSGKATIVVCYYCSVLWPWPWLDNPQVRTWPVSPEDIPADQKWTFYVKAFVLCRPTCMMYYVHYTRTQIDRQIRPKPQPRRFARGINCIPNPNSDPKLISLTSFFKV